MSDRSRPPAFSYAKPPNPSLPKGGGAIRSVGETFRATPARGSLSFDVPVALSEGRQAFAPSLSIAYDSGSGSGLFGHGWQVAIAEIMRRTDRGVPVYWGESDVFLLAGSEDLVPVLGPDGKPDVVEIQGHVVTRFMPRTEGAFARIERWSSKQTGDMHWRVTTRDNVTSVYGDTPESRIADPSDPTHVFSWLLARREDGLGNAIFYEYKQEDLKNVPWSAFESSRLRGLSPITNRHIKRIVYGNTVTTSGHGLDAVRASCRLEVVFDYGEHDQQQPEPEEAPDRAWLARRDPFSSSRAGFEIRTYRLCRRVLVFHQFGELGPEPTLIRTIELAYTEDPLLTKLVSVTQKGHERPAGSTGPYSTKELPSYEFGYSEPEFRVNVGNVEPDETRQLANQALGQQWVDLEGDGLPGLFWRAGDALYYQRPMGQATLAHARRLRTRPTLATGNSPLQIADLAGDGHKQLVWYDPSPLAGYHEWNAEEDTWAPLRHFHSMPNVDWNDPNLRFMDLNGDGLEDLVLVRDDKYIWFPSRGKDGFGEARTFPRGHDEERGPTCVFATHDHSIFLADMTGDGLPDIVRIKHGSICYWPNMGHGKFGAKVQMANAPRFAPEGQFDARRIRLADMDGSGTTDVLYVGGSEGVVLWRNQSGNSWSDPIELGIYPTADARVDVLDLLGNGTACVVWSGPRYGPPQPARYLDPLGGKKPHLLERVTNGLGLEYRFSYAPSTKFYLEDTFGRRPWVTRLHFPVHVLERVERFDHVSRVRLVTEYRYHHGYYDAEEREFGGFGMVEQVDSEAFSTPGSPALLPGVEPLNGELPQPPVLTRTWFHPGAWHAGGAISRQFEKEYYQLDPGAPLLPDTMLPDNLGYRERRQACRALRGQMLRKEVFALDGSPDEPHPYAVTENSFSVRRVQAPHGKIPGVYVVAPREAISLHYERYRASDGKPDPRTMHALTLVVDEYGTVRKSVAVAYPRRLVPADPDHAAQGRLAVTLTETDVAHLASSAEGYRLGVPIETRTYEVHGLTAPARIFSFEQMAALAPPPDQAPLPEIEHEDWPPPVGQQPPSSATKRLIERVRIRYYDSANLPSPLPLGSADPKALAYESYQLALTPGQIAKRFNEGEQRVTPQILAEAGYVELVDDLGSWIPSGRQVFDPTKFYLPVAYIDPFGGVTSVEYDGYVLLVERIEDPLGNEILVQNDYRTLSPVVITDANGNRAAVKLDELGMVVATAVMGKSGSTEGDTLDDPTTTLEYDLFRFQTARKPNFVKARARERHGDPGTPWQESYSYSDGSGHEVMRKVQAEPGPAPSLDADGHVIRGDDGKPVMMSASPRWVGTGRTVFDNKGNPIKRYEPYFSRTHEYEDDAELVHWGVTPILRYDPLGRLIRTDLPNGTFSRLEFTPWSQTSWDENDTVLEPGNAWYAARRPGAQPAPSAAEQRAATLADDHAGTPSVTELDVLGRAYVAVGDLGGGHKVRTRITLDLEGNPLLITDARGNDAMTHAFDVAGRKIKQKSSDAGARWMLTDVLGNPLRVWDSRGHMVRTAYDVLRRPTEIWVQKDGGPERLAERTVYGEGHPQAVALNLRGRVYQQFDGAGVVASEAFDFKGNLLASSRKLAKEYKLALDWSQDPAPTLEAEAFTTSTAYDALNRPVSITKPDQSELRPTYNEAGLLGAVDVRIRGAAAWMPFVTDIDYNEKGQRQAITYGNGVVTEYTYDSLTFRLSRLKTTRPSDSAVLQDLRYTQDPVGNIVEIEDNAQQGELFGSPPVPAGGRHVYDAIYRLIQAEGREHPGQQPTHEEIPRHSIPHSNDVEALRSYTELYEYDDVGNILAMIHQAGSATVWRRRYNVAEDSNRLLGTSLPGDQEGEHSATYSHDEHGNMTSMPHLASIGWDFKDQKRGADLGGGGKAYYVYNAAGERIRKVWEHSGVVEERLYLGGYEVYRRREGPQAELVLERETLHVMDDTQRIALVETKTVDTSVPPFTPTPRVRYQLGNHLGSAMLELDQVGLVISYEEYHPYGTTAYHAARAGVEVSAKRYRYTGKERDEETGLYYHGARYYAPWLGRWTAADPAGMVDGANLYAYVRANPVRLHDPGGRQGTVKGEQQVKNTFQLQLTPVAADDETVKPVQHKTHSVFGDRKDIKPPSPQEVKAALDHPTAASLPTSAKKEPEPQTVRPAPPETLGDVAARIATLDEPPDEFGPYSIAYHIKHDLVEPTRRWLANEPQSYLDAEHNVRTSSVQRDYSQEMAPVLGEIAITLAPPARGARDALLAPDLSMGAGRLGGPLVSPSRLAAAERYLANRGIVLRVGDAYLPPGAYGGFNARTGALVLRSNPTRYELQHELAHYIHYRKLGPEAYSAQSVTAKEQFVFDTLQGNPKRWESLTPEQRQHAQWYIDFVGGIF